MITTCRQTFENCRNLDKCVHRIQIDSMQNITFFRLKDDVRYPCARSLNLEYLGLRRDERLRYCRRHQVDERYAVASILTGKTLVEYEPYQTQRGFSITVQSNGFCLHCGDLTSEFLWFENFFSDTKSLKAEQTIDELLAGVL